MNVLLRTFTEFINGGQAHVRTPRGIGGSTLNDDRSRQPFAIRKKVRPNDPKQTVDNIFREYTTYLQNKCYNSFHPVL